MNTPVGFVNIHGQPIDPATMAHTSTRTPRETQDKFHKGWRVVGLPPDAIEIARIADEVERANIRAHNERVKEGKAHEAIKDPPPVRSGGMGSQCEVAPRSRQALRAERLCARVREACRAGRVDARHVQRNQAGRVSV